MSRKRKLNDKQYAAIAVLSQPKRIPSEIPIDATE